MDIRLALMTGIDIPIPECQLVIHQPKMKEIAFIGETNFFTGAQILIIDRDKISQDKDVLVQLTNFQIFMTVIQEKEVEDKKGVVKQLLNLLFPSYKIIFSPKSLIFQKDNQNTILVDESNFFYLQQIIKAIFCFDKQQEEEFVYNPGNEKAKQIAEKLKRGREKAAELSGANKVSIFSQYLSSLCVGLHIPLNELAELTVFQIYDLMERMALYINWDVDLRCRLAGGTPDSQPENWMKNIH